MDEHETGVSVSWFNYDPLSIFNSLSRDKVVYVELLHHLNTWLVNRSYTYHTFHHAEIYFDCQIISSPTGHNYLSEDRTIHI